MTIVVTIAATAMLAVATVARNVGEPGFLHDVTLGHLEEGSASIALLNDGRTVVAVSPTGRVQLHDRVTAVVINEFSTARDGVHVTAMVILPADTLLAVGFSDGTVLLQPLLSERPQRLLTAFARPVTALCGDPGGGLIAAGSDLGTVAVWTLREHERRFFKVAHGSTIAGLVLHAGQDLLVSASDRGEITAWHYTNGLKAALLRRGADERNIVRLAIAADAGLLAAAPEGGRVLVWNLAGTSPPAERSRPEAPRQEAATALCFLDDPLCLVGAWPVDGISVLDLDTETRRADPRLFPAPVRCLAASGTLLLVGGDDPAVRVWHRYNPVGGFTSHPAESDSLIRSVASLPSSAPQEIQPDSPPVPVDETKEAGRQIELTAGFEETSGDGRLEACEDGTLVVAVKNVSAMTITGIGVHLRGDEHLAPFEPMTISSLAAGASQSLTRPLRWKENSKISRRHLELTAIASAGRSDVIRLKVPFDPIGAPAIRIADVLVDGVTGGVVIAGRHCSVTIHLRNEGEGPALGARATLRPPSGDAATIIARDVNLLGDVAPGAIAELRFTVEAHNPGDTIAIDLLLTEACGLFDTTLRLGLTVGAPIPTDNSGG